MPWPDETRSDEVSAYRIKLFKEARQQERSTGPDGVLPVRSGTRALCVVPVVRSLGPGGLSSAVPETGRRSVFPAGAGAESQRESARRARLSRAADD
jgi:hypothetical protein